MLIPRLIPALLIQHGSLIKTQKFDKFVYVGDPCNTARIFNNLEADELIIFDVGTARFGSAIDWRLLEDLAEECFMPLAYGGAVRSLSDASQLFEIGFEKVSINSACLDSPDLIDVFAREFGSQAVVVSIDVASDSVGRRFVRHPRTRRSTARSPVTWAQEVEKRGAGEIFLTDVDREGTWLGMNRDLISEVAKSVSIPVVAHGGASSLNDVRDAIWLGGATSAAVGNMVVFQKPHCGVLVHYPTREELDEVFGV